MQLKQEIKLERCKRIYSIGSSNLLSYLDEDIEYQQIMLMIPSVINKSYILDIASDNSLVEFFKSQNIGVYLIEFNDPLSSEEDYGFYEYFLYIIAPYLQKIAEIHYNKKISVLGYCLGGLFAVYLAEKYPSIISSLILIASPWDMSNISYINIIEMAYKFINLADDKIVQKSLIYNVFIMLNLEKYVEKYTNFSNMTDPDKIQQFIKIENWIQNGINLTLKISKEILGDLYINNRLFLESKIGDLFINVDNIKCRSISILPKNDYLVPLNSAKSLANLLPSNTILEVDSGHIGMIVGSLAKEICWQPLYKWLNFEVINVK